MILAETGKNKKKKKSAKSPRAPRARSKASPVRRNDRSGGHTGIRSDIGALAENSLGPGSSNGETAPAPAPPTQTGPRAAADPLSSDVGGTTLEGLMQDASFRRRVIAKIVQKIR